MDKSNPQQFWIGVIAGLLVALVINYLITIGGAFAGGIAAGWIAGGGLLNALVLGVAITVFGMQAAPNDLGILGFLGSTLIIIVVFFPLFGLFGYVGGLLGGYLRK
jgi:hypothetical protein